MFIFNFSLQNVCLLWGYLHDENGRINETAFEKFISAASRHKDFAVDTMVNAKEVLDALCVEQTKRHSDGSYFCFLITTSEEILDSNVVKYDI